MEADNFTTPSQRTMAISVSSPVHSGRVDQVLKFRELDTILAYFGNVKGLLIDIRFNQGGGDRFVYGVVGRFVEKSKVGYYRYRRRRGGGL